jgi:CheY-like chemotaxis protein
LIWLSSEATDDEIAVRVKDQGIGIPAAMLPQIFDMFVQVDRSLERSQGGLGIGLTLVKRLVELHGGSVEAHSPGEGLGSEFVVRLPRVRTLLADETAPVQGGQSAQGLRVLIADDNEDAAESLVQLLAMMGNTVHRAKDGLQAVEMAEHLRPEVIVLDIGMPGLNGFEACRRIRAQPWNQGVVMIALTGWGQDDDRRRSTDAGFDRHLVKPVDPLMLEKLMSDLR